MNMFSFEDRFGGARNGQAMLIAIISLTGAILGATAIAGFLTLYTIRSTTNYTASAQAIYAADTGANWILMYQFNTANAGLQPTVLGNGATISETCYNAATPAVMVNCNDPTAVSGIAEGASEDNRRAFDIDISAAETPGP